MDPRGFLIVSSLLFSGCGDGWESVVELGRLEYYQMPQRVSAPTSGTVNDAFPVQVMTYGGGCINFERTDVIVTGDVAEIIPYDRRDIQPDGSMCTADLRFISHEASVMFTTAGPKSIRVQGRRVERNLDEIIEIPFSITIQ